MHLSIETFTIIIVGTTSTSSTTTSCILINDDHVMSIRLASGRGHCWLMLLFTTTTVVDRVFAVCHQRLTVHLHHSFTVG